MVFFQVVLSFGIPLALVPLMVLTSRREPMVKSVNSPVVSFLGGLVAAVIVMLNGLFLFQLVGVLFSQLAPPQIRIHAELTAWSADLSKQ